MFPFLLNDFPLHVLDFFIDSLTSLCLPINFLYQLLNLLLLDVSSLLRDILLLDLLGHLHLLHLKLFKQFVILHLKLAHFLILLAELRLERIVEGSHIVLKLSVFAHLFCILGLAFLHGRLVVLFGHIVIFAVGALAVGGVPVAF